MRLTLRWVLAGLAIAVLAVVVGLIRLDQVGELADRTDRAVAVYENATLTYATRAGETITIAQTDDCKQYARPPSRDCRQRYADGDEVVISFDSADPTRTWKGPTPGGQLATGLLWGGMALGIFALLWLWFASPLYRRLRRPEIAGQQAPPAELE
ncbi:MAG: hypothetical protein OXL97_10280 [Chloroflexota bacterium]|nr:hypothetical protein [Chloroflexota bacterium]MDE2886207.1 hypothetical protein [Chloroflexota bacterium]